MARSIQQIEEQIQCSICRDDCEEPKQLLCLHVFCKSCVQRLVPKDPRAERIIRCPNCRKPTPIPAGGVDELPTAFYIINLIEVRNTMRSESSAGSRRSRLVSNASSMGSSMESSMGSSMLSMGSSMGSSFGSSFRSRRPSSTSKPKFPCTEHKEVELELYCNQCEEVICYECTIDKHNGHKYNKIDKVVEDHRKQMKPLIEPVEEKMKKVEKALGDLGYRHEEVSKESESIEKKVSKLAQNLHDAINARKTTLMNELQKIAQAKMKAINEERDVKETVHARLSGCARMVKEAITDKSNVEMLQAEKELKKKVGEVSTDYFEYPDITEAVVKVDMLFSIPQDLVQKPQNIGQVLSSPSSIDPLQCIAKGEGLEIASVEEKTIIHLKAVSHKGQPCEEPIQTLQCVLVFEETGTTMPCEVENVNRSLYKITYTPKAKGRHKLHIVVEGQHIRGSPFAVAVKRAVERLGRLVFLIENLKLPWGICVNKNGELVVTEFLRHQISIFSPTGEKLREIGSFGSRKGQLNGPQGVAVDSEGNIFVVDRDNYRVQKFTTNGRYLASGGHKGSGPKEFRDPKGLAFNSINNKVYVVDRHRIQVMNSDLTFSGTFGSKGKGVGEFENSFAIACDSIGNVYVSDNKNSNIQIFTCNGQFLRMFACQANHPPHASGKALWGSVGVSEPVALAIDDSGMVYVSENDGSRVSVLTPQGYCKASFGKEGLEYGEFKWPRGIAVTSTGAVWVCDFKNDRIQVF